MTRLKTYAATLAFVVMAAIIPLAAGFAASADLTLI